MSRAVKKATVADIELNRWAISMAMTWPVITTHYNHGNALGVGLPGYGANIQRGEGDADVIGRADKIIAWVKAKH